MNILAITPTKNRHQHLEKLVGCFMNQDCEEHHTLLIYNNAYVIQRLDMGDGLEYHEDNKHIILINQFERTGGGEYENLGQIYNDILHNYLVAFPDNTLVNHMDDDDTFLPNHFSEGLAGYIRGSYLGNRAYKPAKSYFRQAHGISLETNVLEPSIFVDLGTLRKYGYRERNHDAHHEWFQPLVHNKEIFVDNAGKPTFIYDWGGDIPTWKTSGDPHNPENFKNYTNFSTDFGDQLITPLPLDKLKRYYEVPSGS